MRSQPFRYRSPGQPSTADLIDAVGYLADRVKELDLDLRTIFRPLSLDQMIALNALLGDFDTYELAAVLNGYADKLQDEMDAQERAA